MIKIIKFPLENVDYKKAQKITHNATKPEKTEVTSIILGYTLKMLACCVCVCEHTHAHPHSLWTCLFH